MLISFLLALGKGRVDEIKNFWFLFIFNQRAGILLTSYYMLGTGNTKRDRWFTEKIDS